MSDPTTNGAVGGRPRTAKGDAARRVLRELGPGVTLEAFKDRLNAEQGEQVSDGTYYQLRREMYPDGVRVAPLPDRPEPAQDYLTRAVRFWAQVEAVGGVEVALNLIEHYRALGRQFKGE